MFEHWTLFIGENVCLKTKRFNCVSVKARTSNLFVLKYTSRLRLRDVRTQLLLVLVRKAPGYELRYHRKTNRRQRQTIAIENMQLKTKATVCRLCSLLSAQRKTNETHSNYSEYLLPWNNKTAMTKWKLSPNGTKLTLFRFVWKTQAPPKWFNMIYCTLFQWSEK